MIQTTKILLTVLLCSVAVRAQNVTKMDYNTEWKKIDVLIDDKNLPQSALTEVQKVYSFSLNEKNYPQTVKAVIYRMNLTGQLEENSTPAVISLLKKEAQLLPQPAQSIIYSLMGDVYKLYYQQNRWRIMQRTRSTVASDDIETWDASRLFEEALKCYTLSVQQAETLQNTPLKQYDALVEYIRSDDKEEIHPLLPTLYDFLVFRTIEALKSELNVVLPQQTFALNKPEYFGDTRTFAACNIASDDSLSVEYRVITLYQQLLRFRLQQLESDRANSDSHYALVNIDVERLRYVRTNGRYNNSDALYEKALLALMNTHSGTKVWNYPAFALAFLYDEQGQAWQKSRKAEHRYRCKEAYRLCQQIIDSGGDKIITEHAQQLQKKITAPSVQLTLENQQLCDAPILALAQYSNVEKLWLHVYRLSNEEAMNTHEWDFNFGTAKVFRRQEIKLPATADYQNYAAEIKIDDLPQGNYALFVTLSPAAITNKSREDNTQLLAATTIKASALKVAVRGGIGSSEPAFQAYVTNSRTGQPLHNATVAFYTRRYQQGKGSVEELQGTYSTGEDGIVNIPRMGNRAAFKKAIVTHNGASLLLTQWNTPYWDGKIPHKYERVLFFTDRAIYRPGQTVYYKALCIATDGDGNNELVTKKAMEVELKDVNYKTIATQQLTTGDYGTLQGSFTIPQGLLNGTMQLRTEGGSVSFEVEEYKRPTFEVNFNPVEANFALNDSVALQGMAKALAGYSVDGAKVHYRVVRTAQHRLLRRWWYPPVVEPQREIASGEVMTNENGIFKIIFKAEADDVKNTDIIYIYDVSADVTDPNGETQSTLFALKVSSKPLLVVTSLPERIADLTQLNFDLATTNLNGDFTPADVEVTITALQQPNRILRERQWQTPDTFAIEHDNFVRWFPNDPYGNEALPENYKEVKQIASFTTKTEQSKSNKLDLTVLKEALPGWYRVSIKARSQSGVEVTDIHFVQLTGSSATKSLPIRNMDEWLTVVKNSAEPGENVAFMIAGGSEKSYIRCEVLLKDKVIETKHLEVGTVPQQIAVPVKEAYRGGFAVQFVMVQNNRTYSQLVEVNVPYTNRMLDVEFTTFRKLLLPGEKEKWTLTVKNKTGEKEMAEMVATLYDASLDAFRLHSWPSPSMFYPQRNHQHFYWQMPEYSDINTTSYMAYSHPWASEFIPAFPVLNQFGGYYHSLGAMSTRRMMKRSRAGAKEEIMMEFAVADDAMEYEEEIMPVTRQDGIAPPSPSEPPLANVALRSNFNETAFFYPQLRTDEEGKIIIDFAIPEALTRWKMMGFAHTSNFKVGTVSGEVVTQKQVAISANAPRFFRESDIITFTAKVNNITGNDLAGSALLQLYDAMTMQPVNDIIQTEATVNFDVKAGQSTGVKWTLKIPTEIGAVTCRVTAQAGEHTDGEERVVPVLTNSMLVTEAMPFSIRAGETKKLSFDRMKNNTSSTLRNHRLTLEFTSNPAWYAIQAMPYLMEYPYECSEQIFSRFYANSLSATITAGSPRIKQVFDLWRTMPDNGNALLSNLEKNQELKQVLLEETPWVMQANNEAERKQRVALLFDLNRMASEQRHTMEQLKKAQMDDGAFPWFDGLPPSRYITQHIVSGMEHLRKFNALEGELANDASAIVTSALLYMHKCATDDYRALLKQKGVDLSKQHIGTIAVHYLYACSFGAHKPADTEQRKSFDFYFNQAAKYWTQFGIYSQATIALVMHRYGNKDVASDIIRSLNERALRSSEMGMYWKNNVAGYFWYQSPIETQAMLIEAFNEVAADVQAVEEMKVWLLRNKQTTDWRTTKATAEACYALLMTGHNLLDDGALLEVNIGRRPLAKAAVDKVSAEAGTGYVKTSWSGNSIKKSMAELEVTNPNKAGIAWGGVYWQYFEQLDKITGAETSLRMNKQLFVKRNSARGAVLVPLTELNSVNIGDVVTVRVELRADRDYEYVHLKDMRASGFEPVKQLSGYRVQDGLWYYQSMKDASANFFISYLPKGTFVFEYELRVVHAGDFSNGITTFQCMYAPEFNAHSEGVRVKTEE